MAMQLMRIASLVLVVTLATLSGCAGTTRIHGFKNVIAEQRKAEKAYEEGHLAEALAGYEALTRTLPDNVDFWFRLGNIQVRMEKPALAAEAYARVLRLDSGNAKAWHNLGIVRMRQAAAAFAQSARVANANAPELGRASAQMAHSLAELVSPANQAPPKPRPTTRAGRETAPVTGGTTP